MIDRRAGVTRLSISILPELSTCGDHKHRRSCRLRVKRCPASGSLVVRGRYCHIRPSLPELRLREEAPALSQGSRRKAMRRVLRVEVPNSASASSRNSSAFPAKLFAQILERQVEVLGVASRLDFLDAMLVSIRRS
jgi:hypothetical protein